METVSFLILRLASEHGRIILEFCKHIQTFNLCAIMAENNGNGTTGRNQVDYYQNKAIIAYDFRSSIKWIRDSVTELHHSCKQIQSKKDTKSE